MFGPESKHPLTHSLKMFLTQTMSVFSSPPPKKTKTHTQKKHKKHAHTQTHTETHTYLSATYLVIFVRHNISSISTGIFASFTLLLNYFI